MGQICIGRPDFNDSRDGSGLGATDGDDMRVHIERCAQRERIGIAASNNFEAQAAGMLITLSMTTLNILGKQLTSGERRLRLQFGELRPNFGGNQSWHTEIRNILHRSFPQLGAVKPKKFRLETTKPHVFEQSLDVTARQINWSTPCDRAPGVGCGPKMRR